MYSTCIKHSVQYTMKYGVCFILSVQHDSKSSEHCLLSLLIKYYWGNIAEYYILDIQRCYTIANDDYNNIIDVIVDNYSYIGVANIYNANNELKQFHDF
jgi:hypothetical protein